MKPNSRYAILAVATIQLFATMFITAANGQESLRVQSKFATGDGKPHFVNQGNNWTDIQRELFYTGDQGARIMPLAWMRALMQPNGKPFLEYSLSRYGFLENPQNRGAVKDVPVGFAIHLQDGQNWIGMTCSACHTREIEVQGDLYRIDGGPAIADTQGFLADLDMAVERVVNGGGFDLFAVAVLGKTATEEQKAELRRSVATWHRRNSLHTRATLDGVSWGPGRMDAVTMIFNRIGGLGVGARENDYILQENFAPGTAPTRFPFLWNAWKQDCSQWSGIARNTDKILRVARDMGQVYGLFSRFHPVRVQENWQTHDYLGKDKPYANTLNMSGLKELEDILELLESPKWQWSIDQELRDRGKIVFEEKKDAASGQSCNDCHGIKPDGENVWKTHLSHLANLQTDAKLWEILKRSIRTGELENGIVVSLDGDCVRLRKSEPGVKILTSVVVETLIQIENTKTQALELCEGLFRKNPLPEELRDVGRVYYFDNRPGSLEGSEPEEPQCAKTPDIYEGRVLQGIWAAAPYLHNGSVPSLRALLTPPNQRKSFEVGIAYDIVNVGLAPKQEKIGSYLLKTTDCSDRHSGNSHCGHAYGTDFSDEEKNALIEYLKTL